MTYVSFLFWLCGLGFCQWACNVASLRLCNLLLAVSRVLWILAKLLYPIQYPFVSFAVLTVLSTFLTWCLFRRALSLVVSRNDTSGLSCNIARARRVKEKNRVLVVHVSDEDSCGGGGERTMATMVMWSADDKQSFVQWHRRIVRRKFAFQRHMH